MRRRATRASEERSSTRRSGRTSRRRVVNDTKSVDHPRKRSSVSHGDTDPETMRPSVAEARYAPSKRVRTRAGLPQGGSASRGRSRLTPAKDSVIRMAQAVAAWKSSEPSGARVVGWLQRSVRSIFSSRPRVAARRTEGAVGSTFRRALVTEGEVRAGRKGARRIART